MHSCCKIYKDIYNYLVITRLLQLHSLRDLCMTPNNMYVMYKHCIYKEFQSCSRFCLLATRGHFLKVSFQFKFLYQSIYNFLLSEGRKGHGLIYNLDGYFSMIYGKVSRAFQVVSELWLQCLLDHV